MKTCAVFLSTLFLLVSALCAAQDLATVQAWINSGAADQVEAAVQALGQYPESYSKYLLLVLPGGNLYPFQCCG